MEQKSFAEFFAGVGLVRLALEKNGWTCGFANDLDEKKRDIYESNFGSEHFVLDDIWNINSNQIPINTELFTASFPCVDLSEAGNRRGLDAQRSGTLWAFMNILQQKRRLGDAPKVVLLENVYGFLTTNGGEDLRATLRSLDEIGYSVDVFVVNARHFTPQSRVRLFVVGIDKAFCSDAIIRRDRSEILSEWQSNIEQSDEDLRPKRLVDFIIDEEVCDWFTIATPDFPKRNLNLPDTLEDYETEHSIWWSQEKHDKIMSQIPPKHLQYLEKFKNEQICKYGTIFRRMRKGKSTAELRVDGIAGCLRTPRGGSSKQILAKTGQGRIQFRLLTPREYARLQGVNDDFILSPNNNASYFAMGDAVCVPAISWIVERYLDPLMTPKER